MDPAHEQQGIITSADHFVAPELGIRQRALLAPIPVQNHAADHEAGPTDYDYFRTSHQTNPVEQPNAPAASSFPNSTIFTLWSAAYGSSFRWCGAYCLQVRTAVWFTLGGSMSLGFSDIRGSTFECEMFCGSNGLW